MNIQEILKNSKDFQDDLTATLTGPDGNVIEIPLRDLRQKFRAADADYTRKSQELADQARQFEAQKLEWARIQQARPEPVAPDNSAGIRGQDELDELFRPVMDRVSSKYDPALKQVEELQNLVKAREAENLRMATIFVEREIDRSYRSLPEKPMKEDGTPMTAKEFARYAVSRGYTDEHQFPDFERASNDFFGPKRIEKQLSDAREAGKREAMEEVQRAAFMPKPGLRRPFSEGEPSGQTANKTGQAKSPQANYQDAGGINRSVKNPQLTNKSRTVFSEALAEAMNDPSIREGLFNLNRG